MSNMISRKNLNKAYRTTLADIHGDMRLSRRLVSTIIHAPAMDATLDILSRTLFRPRPILYAAITATAGLTILAFNAYSIGYTLSGIEIPTLALIGWLIGWTAELPHIYRKYK